MHVCMQAEAFPDWLAVIFAKLIIVLVIVTSLVPEKGPLNVCVCQK